MRIAIEAQRIFRENKHGMDFVILETIRELQKLDTENEYYIYVSPGADRCLSETKNFHIIELKFPTYPLWEQVALCRAVNKLKPDLLHCTSNTAPLRCKVPLILTLHDIIFLEPRQQHNGSLYQEIGWYYRRFIVPRILHKCRRIITVSHYEYKNIQEKLSLPENALTYIYNGISARFKPKPSPYQITKKYIEHEDFLFFLGNTDPKKNVANTLKAYSIYLAQSARKLPLLIADMNESAIDKVLVQENISHIKSKLRYSGYINNEDLPVLYSGAFAFLYTSLRESFGIPLLESMACGTPVITSNTSSMPEIAGAEAILADPYVPEDIAKQILSLENDKELYASQKSYGIMRAKEFTWKHTAEQVLEQYLDLKK